VGHEAVDFPKEKRVLTRLDSTYHGPEALKKQRLHTNNQDLSVAMDGRDEVQKLTVKEKQGTLTCNHECSFEDKKGKCCRWEIGAVASFRSGVSSI
jgi:hypothetical protein